MLVDQASAMRSGLASEYRHTIGNGRKSRNWCRFLAWLVAVSCPFSQIDDGDGDCWYVTGSICQPTPGTAPRIASTELLPDSCRRDWAGAGESGQWCTWRERSAWALGVRSSRRWRSANRRLTGRIRPASSMNW